MLKKLFGKSKRKDKNSYIIIEYIRKEDETIDILSKKFNISRKKIRKLNNIEKKYENTHLPMTLKIEIEANTESDCFLDN